MEDIRWSLNHLLIGLICFAEILFACIKTSILLLLSILGGDDDDDDDFYDAVEDDDFKMSVIPSDGNVMQ